MNEISESRLQQIKIVSFDLDDTLWDLPPVIKQAEETLYEWIGSNWPDVTAQYSIEEIADHRFVFADRNSHLRVDVTALRKGSLSHLFADFNLPESAVEEAFDVFYRARSQVTLYEDALPMLERIGKHYHLAALTNGNADLGLIGIEHLFDDVQKASLSMAPKPDASMFLATARKFGVEPGEILHIGDNQTTDVIGGNDAGSLTVWFNQSGDSWDHPEQRPDFEIKTLTSLETILPLLSSSVS